MKGLALVITAAVCVASVAAASANARVVPPAPQRVAAEQWVTYFDAGNQRAACEIQATPQAMGLPCEQLPIHSRPQTCPEAGPNAKPPFRKSEIRSPSEQVGAYVEENPLRGYVRINAQIKAKKLWGALGLEQIAGDWRITYLRYASEVFAPAGNSYQSEGWHKLWISTFCLTEHPAYEGKK